MRNRIIYAALVAALVTANLAVGALNAQETQGETQAWGYCWCFNDPENPGGTIGYCLETTEQPHCHNDGQCAAGCW